MSEKRAGKVVSVTDIGSNFVRMGVYQAGKGGVQRLDYLEVPLRLGHEVFATGRISVSTVRQLSSILRGYAQVMREYGVTEYRAIATTAMREAKNRAYVLDQLRIQNNLVVEVLEDGEESSLVYSALCRSPLLREESLLSYVGTGSVGLAVWRQGAVDLSCNLTIGFLKLSEMLRGQEELTARFYRVLEEYVENYFQRVALRLDGQTFSRILLSGRQLDSIAALCGGREEKGALVVERRQLEEMYALLKGMNASTVAREMQLSEEVADQIAPMLAIYRRMLVLHRRKAGGAAGQPDGNPGPPSCCFRRKRPPSSRRSGRGPWPPAAGWPCGRGRTPPCREGAQRQRPAVRQAQKAPRHQRETAGPAGMRGAAARTGAPGQRQRRGAGGL